jgi:hypothetical protein
VEMGQTDLLPTTSCQVSNNKSPKNLCLFEEQSDSLETALPFTEDPIKWYRFQYEVSTGTIMENC